VVRDGPKKKAEMGYKRRIEDWEAARGVGTGEDAITRPFFPRFLPFVLTLRMGTLVPNGRSERVSN